jgi:hypothetical protein
MGLLIPVKPMMTKNFTNSNDLLGFFKSYDFSYDTYSVNMMGNFLLKNYIKNFNMIFKIYDGENLFLNLFFFKM